VQRVKSRRGNSARGQGRKKAGTSQLDTTRWWRYSANHAVQDVRHVGRRLSGRSRQGGTGRNTTVQNGTWS
jgi:hypothetical protein